MIIHDDADMAEVVQMTIDAINEGATHIGKADREISTDQISKIQVAIAALQATLEFKKRMKT